MINLWDRLIYVLSPQFDVYKSCSKVVRGKVADVGCGTGFGTHLLTIHAESVRAFDNDRGALLFASSCFPFPNLSFALADVTKGLDGLYDYILMIDVIEHIQDDKKAIEVVARHLNKDGVFLCSTPNRLYRPQNQIYPGHVREYSPQEFEKLLKTTFGTVDIRNWKFTKSEDVNQQETLLAVCGK